MRNVIVNTSPLIVFNDLGKLDLLKNLYGQVIIPHAVYEELTAKSSEHLISFEAFPWIKVTRIQNELAKKFFETQLHAEEVEVMILAKEQSADLVIIDDANAKKHAKRLGITTTGTLGVLIKAKNEGFIDNLQPLIEEMQFNGFYISKSIVDACLRLAGE